MKFNLTWSVPFESWRMGDPKPLAETLRGHEGNIPQDVRYALAEALLSGPVRTKRDLHRDALNYLYRAATALEAAKQAGVKSELIRRWKKEAIDHVTSTTTAKPATIDKALQRYRRDVRNSVVVGLYAASMKPRASVRRYEAGRQARVKPQQRNLRTGPNSVFALGLENSTEHP